MNSCTICDKEVKLIYNNTFEDMKIFNCTNCEVSYIVTPNSFGQVLEIRCNACGKIADITNIENW